MVYCNYSFLSFVVCRCGYLEMLYRGLMLLVNSRILYSGKKWDYSVSYGILSDPINII